MALSAGLAACDPPVRTEEASSETASAAERSGMVATYANDLETDVSGYYRPSTEAMSGNWRFDHLFLGQEADFEAWEAGRREGRFAPVMLEFVDESSPLVATEMGEVRSGRLRVLPHVYVIEDGLVRFVGVSDELGVVTLEVKINFDALATARRNLGHEGAVMNGTLTMGQDTPRAVGLRWWAGD